MKLFKSLVMYCIIIIFIMSLTSSFELSSSNKRNIAQLSIKSSKMYEVFYNSPNLKENTLKDEVSNDSANIQETTIDASTEYAIGDSGEEVFKYQKLLYYMDYIKNTPDGNFGDEMKSAIEMYQENKDKEVTGKLNAQTQESLLLEPIDYIMGKTGDEIKEYQMILYYLDYLQVYPDGKYGAGTETSVRKYQKDKELEITGIIDHATQESLNKEEIVYISGKKGDEIKTYQTTLITLGYLTGVADGKYGSNSINAIKKYQTKNNLEQTGIIDIPTQTSLKRPIEEQEKF